MVSCQKELFQNIGWPYQCCLCASKFPKRIAQRSCCVASRLHHKCPALLTAKCMQCHCTRGIAFQQQRWHQKAREKLWSQQPTHNAASVPCSWPSPFCAPSAATLSLVISKLAEAATSTTPALFNTKGSFEMLAKIYQINMNLLITGQILSD